MRNKPRIARDTQILAILLLCGCASQNRDLACLDSQHIIQIAKQELREKAPDFQQSKYDPDSIAFTEFYHDDGVGQSITLTFRSKQPVHVEERASFTNGYVAVQASKQLTFEMASITMTPQGKLMQNDVSEWEDIHDWQYVRHYQVWQSIKKFPGQPWATSLFPTNSHSFDKNDPFCLPLASP